jgi:hypothetical protein
VSGPGGACAGLVGVAVPLSGLMSSSLGQLTKVSADIATEQDGTQVLLKMRNMRSRATAWLMLTHQLTLALHHTSIVLQHKGRVHHSLEILKVPGLQSIDQSIIQSSEETFLLFLISVSLIGSLARQLSEYGDVLIHRHGSLLQILELLLQLDHSLGNMVSTESSSKLRPVDALRFFMSFHVHIPPISCRS